MDADQKKVLKILASHNAKLVRTGHHNVWKFPDGRIFVTAQSGSDWRGWKNNLGDLRRLLGIRTEAPQGVVVQRDVKAEQQRVVERRTEQAAQKQAWKLSEFTPIAHTQAPPVPTVQYSSDVREASERMPTSSAHFAIQSAVSKHKFQDYKNYEWRRWGVTGKVGESFQYPNWAIAVYNSLKVLDPENADQYLADVRSGKINADREEDEVTEQALTQMLTEINNKVTALQRFAQSVEQFRNQLRAAAPLLNWQPGFSGSNSYQAQPAHTVRRGRRSPTGGPTRREQIKQALEQIGRPANANDIVQALARLGYSGMNSGDISAVFANDQVHGNEAIFTRPDRGMYWLAGRSVSTAQNTQ